MLDPDSTALLMIDVINDFDFPDSDRLLQHALPAARRLAMLRRRLAGLGIPTIYVNDNFGNWQSDFRDQILRCTESASKGSDVCRILLPGPEDYFILKPKHSGFYSTSLEVLLGFLGTKTLILSGFAGDICVLYTANDAYMRDYEIVVATDCVASESVAGNRSALDHMKRLLKARVVNSGRIR